MEWFLTTRLGRSILAGLAGAVLLWLAYTLVYNYGYADAKAECNTAALQAEIKTLKADLTAAQKAGADALARAQKITEQNELENKQVRDYAEHLKSQANAACVLNSDDIKWLHNGRAKR